MTAIRPLTTQIERLTAASEWLLRLNDPARTDQDIADWLAWCDAAPGNMQAFEEIQRDWRDMDALALPLSPPRGERVKVRGRPRYWLQAAAVAAVAITAAASYHLYTHRPIQHLAASTVNKTATLPDGSSIVLGARTRLDIDFTGGMRRLQLSPGEAYFKVSQDKQRPFIVQTGDLNATALGTAFNIRRNPDRIIITVEDGTVRISSPLPLPGGEGQGEGASPPPTWHARAGDQLTYSISTRTATLTAVNPENFLKWRNGELAYDAETLGNVIADVNRYSRHHILLQHDDATLTFTGTVFVNAIDDWLTAIQHAYALRADHRPTGEILLLPSSPRPQSGRGQGEGSSIR